jgi:predicted Zn-dependent peptidase
VDQRELVDVVAEAFGGLEGRRPVETTTEPSVDGAVELVEKSTEQVHFCLGTKGFPQESNDKYALAAIDAVLGGGMSSRLFQEIRESRGLAYAIGSYSASYRAAGLLAIYGGTSIESVKQVLELTRAECESIRINSVTDEELERAKNQIRGALVLGQESMSNRMSRLAKNEVYFGRIVRTEEVISKILEVSKDDVANVASRLFQDSRFTVAAIGPFKKHPELGKGLWNATA